MIELEIPRELFERIRVMREDDFDRFVYERIASLRRYLEMNDEEALLARKREIEERIKRMKEEIEELTAFCEKAKKDQERMSLWIDELEIENKSLLAEMRENGDYIASRKAEKEKI